LRRLFLLLFFAVTLGPIHAQNFFVNLDAGAANYDGELQPKRYTFHESHPGGGLGLGYEISPHFNLSTGLLYTQISGNDKYNVKTSDQLRNLNFTSNILEWNLRAEYVLFDLEDRPISPYIFGGIAVFHFNPYTHDSTGSKVFLHPLSTEGEGLAAYPDRKEYSLVQPAIPFGMGVRLALSENIRVGLEVGIRKTFTGYLDDVSGDYANEATLLAAKGPEAVALAFRENELPNHGAAVYPSDTHVRGDGTKDWYYFTAVRVSIRLGGTDYTTRKHLGCPKTPL
jgi:hypothetical protein